MQLLDQSKFYMDDFELPIHFEVGNGEPNLFSSQKSWSLMEAADNTSFNWGDLQEPGDMMEWQSMKGSLDTSIYWGQQPF
jgi:hypothetical protein